jgi:signal transduction histidine kinase
MARTTGQSRPDRFHERATPAVARPQDLEGALDANAFLLAEASHALKGGFTVISGWSELLDEHWDQIPEEHRRTAISEIRRRSAEMADVAKGLLREARADAAARMPNIRPVDLGALAAEVARRSLAAHRIRLDAVHATVDTDRDAVAGILEEVLDNAVKYSQRDSTITVRVRRRLHGTVEILVEDDGVGLPDGVDVFAPFVRGVVDGGPEGSGLGLYIARTTAREFGGDLTAADRNGGGARFTVSLPLAVAHPDGDA